MTRPLRILEVCSSRQWIGEAAHVLALSSGMRERGHEVTLIARRGWKLEEHALAEGHDVHSFHFNSGFHPILDSRDLRALRRLIRDRGIDIVHVHRSKEHWLAAFLGRNAPPLIRTRHVVTPLRNDLFNRWLYGKTTRTVCVSHAVQLRYQECGLIETRNGEPRVIHPGAIAETPPADFDRDKTLAQAFPGEESITVALVVARFQGIKGQHTVLDALSRSRLYEKGLRLRLIGRASAEARAQMEALVREKGLSPYVRLDGFISAEELTRAYASADIAIVASRGSEGWSRAAVEAMSHGLPVVATRVGALPEIVSDGVSGILIPPEDAPSMGQALERLVCDSEMRRAFGDAGRRRVLERFNRSRWLDEMEELFRSVTSDAEQAACGASSF